MIKAPVCEIFVSMQGEGHSVGNPCIFVRFYGCTLRCRFDGKECDTPYAVYKEEDKIKYMTSLEIKKDIEKLLKQYPKIDKVIFTGGEPTLYQTIIWEIYQMMFEKISIEVETNGTIPLTKLLEIDEIHFNVSPKLKCSNQLTSEHERRRINWDALHSFPLLTSTFKFVVDTKEDIEEIKSIIKEIKPVNVMLMPKGATREEIIKNSPKVVDWCMKYGYIFSPREHIIIWDSKRGV